MTYSEILSTISTVMAVLGYLYERNKREKIQMAFTEVNTKLQVAQQNTQQVNASLQQATTIVNKVSLSSEQMEELKQRLTYAQSTTASTLSIGLVDPLTNAWQHKSSKASKTIKERNKDKNRGRG